MNKKTIFFVLFVFTSMLNAMGPPERRPSKGYRRPLKEATGCYEKDEPEKTDVKINANIRFKAPYVDFHKLANLTDLGYKTNDPHMSLIQLTIPEKKVPKGFTMPHLLLASGKRLEEDSDLFPLKFEFEKIKLTDKFLLVVFKENSNFSTVLYQVRNDLQKQYPDARIEVSVPHMILRKLSHIEIGLLREQNLQPNFQVRDYVIDSFRLLHVKIVRMDN